MQAKPRILFSQGPGLFVFLRRVTTSTFPESIEGWPNGQARMAEPEVGEHNQDGDNGVENDRDDRQPNQEAFQGLTIEPAKGSQAGEATVQIFL